MWITSRSMRAVLMHRGRGAGANPALPKKSKSGGRGRGRNVESPCLPGLIHMRAAARKGDLDVRRDQKGLFHQRIIVRRVRNVIVLFVGDVAVRVLFLFNKIGTFERGSSVGQDRMAARRRHGTSLPPGDE